MPGSTYIVFKQMRPPVAIDSNGNSPIRTKQGQNVFSNSPKNRNMSFEQVVRQQTDDGRLAD